MEDFLDLVNQVWTSGFLGISMSEVLISLFILIVSLIFIGVFFLLLRGFGTKPINKNSG